MNEKIKSKLDNIVAKHKNLFLAKDQNNAGMLKLKSNFNKAPLASDKLNDELISASNEYLSENNIDDTSELEDYIKIQLKSFYEFCVTGQ